MRNKLLILVVAPLALLGASGLPTYYGSVNSPVGSYLASSVLQPNPVPTPNSSSTIVGFGDSTTYGAYGPTSCVAAANQPSVVTSASATGTCWLDTIARYYGASVQDFAVGGTQLINGSGSGITRYNASYTCPTQSTSPTSGLGQNCKQSAVIPALDSVAGPNTFIYIAYNGINDSSQYPGQVFYSTALSDYNTIIADLIAHGEPANQIIFVGNPRNQTPGIQTQYLAYTAAEALAAEQNGCSFVELWEPLSFSSTFNSNYYDGLHPNDTGSAVWASAIENVQGLNATLAASVYGVVGALYLGNAIPVFNSSGVLQVPGDLSLNASGTATSGQNYASYALHLQNSVWVSGAPANHNWALQTTTANALAFIYNSSTTFLTLNNNGELTSGVAYGANDAFAWPSGTSSGFTSINASNGLTTSGISGSAMNIDNANNGALLSMDTSGNVGLAGSIHAAAHNVCGSSSGWPCETTVTCSISAGTTCSAPAFAAPSGSICTATPNSSDTTTGEYAPKVNNSTFVVTFTVASSQTSTAAANVGCK